MVWDAPGSHTNSVTTRFHSRWTLTPTLDVRSPMKTAYVAVYYGHTGGLILRTLGK
jgi:hypothetical protein